MVSKYDIVDWFGSHYGIRFKRVSDDEYASTNGCPWCGASSGLSDRFHVWREKQNYWCRQCEKTGFLDELTEESKDGKHPTDHERRIRDLEARQRAVERKQAEQERRLSVLERMHASTDHMRYFHNMEVHTEAIEYWDSQGMTLQTIDDYLLGYCPRCPTDNKGRPSYTIPVMAYGKLWNIRHRLIGADNSDKYRPHLAGLPAMLFNADNLTRETDAMLIVEGEKKSIVVAQAGFPNVALMGKSGFQPEWARKFARFNTVVVALDPDAEAQAVEIASQFKGRGRVALLPGKIDDLIVQFGASHEDIEWFIRMARPI